VAATKTLQRNHRTRQHATPPARRPCVSSPWLLKRSGGLQVLQLAPFAKIPWLVHGFSTRPGGISVLDGKKVLNLGFMEWDSREAVTENRRVLQSALAAKGSALLPLKQIHSDVVHLFAKPAAEPPKGDSSLTHTPGLLLGVQTADCVPILLVDPKKRVVAAVHAGWRGTLARITQKTIGRMQLEFGCRPADLLAALGPSIGPCCYEVGVELVAKFTAQFADAHDYFDEPRTGDEPNPIQWLNMAPPGHQPPPKNVHLDLRKANCSQLIASGLRPNNIYATDLCTACRSDLFFSYRREGPLSGRLMSVIGIRAIR
jgi:purine-nucleoside/S-methyl-5'-thioadenosine phosphorylase / adenosine deaminase